MGTLMTTRRTLVPLLSLGIMILACASEQPSGEGTTSTSLSQGYVLGMGEAETLVGGNGEVTIIASPKTSSSHFAMGTQVLRAGTAIPLHRHEHADEAFFVHQGGGVGVVGERRSALAEGDALFVPRGVWHGFSAENEDLEVVWVIAPPGLDDFFRETRVPPGTPLLSLTPEEMEQIGLKHGIRNKPD